MSTVVVRTLTESDLSDVAEVHARAFPRQGHSRSWIESNARGYPRMRYFVATKDNRICGYILWAEKSGFRDEVVLELEQIGVLPSHQGRGIGKALILNSLPEVANQLSERGARLKAVVVTTRADNSAQGLYRKTLGAQVEAVIPNLYSADEVIMIARNPIAHNPLLNRTHPDDARAG